MGFLINSFYSERVIRKWVVDPLPPKQSYFDNHPPPCPYLPPIPTCNCIVETTPLHKIYNIWCKCSRCILYTVEDKKILKLFSVFFVNLNIQYNDQQNTHFIIFWDKNIKGILTSTSWSAQRCPRHKRSNFEEIKMYSCDS